MTGCNQLLKKVYQKYYAPALCDSIILTIFGGTVVDATLCIRMKVYRCQTLKCD